MSLTTKFAELTGVIAAAERSSVKLETGIKCESARARNSLSQASKLVTELRKMCLDHAKALPTKTKVKAEPPIVEPPIVEPVPPPPVLERQAAVTVAEAVPLIADAIQKKPTPTRARNPVSRKR